MDIVVYEDGALRYVDGVASYELREDGAWVVEGHHTTSPVAFSISQHDFVTAILEHKNRQSDWRTHVDELVKIHGRTRATVPCIKYIRGMLKCGLKEAKDIFDAHCPHLSASSSWDDLVEEGL